MSAFSNSFKMFQRNSITKPQQRMILQYMENHPDLFRAKVTKEFTAQMKREMWEELACILNAYGSCVKTAEKWQRAFIDWKWAIKKKAAKIAAAEKQTGGRSACCKELSDCELRLINLINSTTNAKTEAVKETTNEGNLMFPGIQIKQIYSKGIPVMEEPVQVNWKSPSEIDSTNILETQIKLKPVDAVKNFTDNMTGDTLMQRCIEPTSEPASANVLTAQAKLKQTHIFNKKLTPVMHKVMNGSLVTNVTLQNLKPVLDNALGNIPRGRMVSGQTGTLGKNTEQVAYAVISDSPTGKKLLQENVKLTPTSTLTDSFHTHMKLRLIDTSRKNSKKMAFKVKSENSSVKEPPRKKLKIASQTVLTNALEVRHKMMQATNNNNLHPLQKKLSSRSVLKHVMEAQTKIEKQMDRLNENLEKMTHAVTGLTKAITDSCQIMFAALNRNCTNE